MVLLKVRNVPLALAQLNFLPLGKVRGGREAGWSPRAKSEPPTIALNSIFGWDREFGADLIHCCEKGKKKSKSLSIIIYYQINVKFLLLTVHFHHRVCLHKTHPDFHQFDLKTLYFIIFFPAARFCNGFVWRSFYFVESMILISL